MQALHEYLQCFICIPRPFALFMHITFSKARHPHGFTLVELMVVLSLLAMIAAATAPAFGHWFARHQVDLQAHTLLSTFAYARSEAIWRGMRIAICRDDGRGHCSTRAQNCAKTRVAAQDWACGYLVQTEPLAGPGGANGSQLLRIQSGDERLVIMGTAATRVLFRPPAGQIIGGFRRFEIGIRGASADARAGELRRCILIASSGRARLVKAAC
ncbi:GspH/FimT family pseudopilin [Candidatus Glomeribacter gigasporarum]|nr:GspH/FimT family pseudopilin [Candidatus Glomeribacter gigasporarum]